MGTAENPHSGQGMVVLDIGGDIGALVVRAPAAMADVEIEICPSGARGQTPDDGADWWEGDWHSHEHVHEPGQTAEHTHHHHAWPHVAVVGRPAPGGIEYTAVYPGLREGRYDLWQRPDEPTALSVTVVGAQVTTADWPA